MKGFRFIVNMFDWDFANYLYIQCDKDAIKMGELSVNQLATEYEKFCLVKDVLLFNEESV